MIPIWPVEAIVVPYDHTLMISQEINSFGGMHEQRIVTDLPVGPRADGESKLSTFVGKNMFKVGFTNIHIQSQPVVGNTNLDNSVRIAWSFYKARFYDSVLNIPRSESFFWYNKNENDNLLTWTGDVVSSGTNFLGEAVTNLIGRYRVRFGSSDLTISRFRRCLFNFNLEFVEVAE